MKSVGLTILGGAGLLMASMVINLFFESPPSRAEFNSLQVNQIHMLKSLDRIETAQGKIVEYLIND